MIKDNKEQFLQTISSPTMRQNHERTLLAFEEVEFILGKPVTEFSDEEIKNIISNRFGISSTNVDLHRVTINNYLVWLKENGLGERETIKRFFSPNEAIKRTMVYSAQNLHEAMDTMLDKEELKTVDLLVRAYYWLAFSGLEQNDALKIKKRSIDFNDMCIYIEDAMYQIPKEAFFVFYNCVHSTHFNLIRTDYTTSRQRVKSQFLFSGFRSVLNKTIMTSKINEKNAGCFYNLTYSSVRKSGLFITLYENEKMGIMPDFSATDHIFYPNKVIMSPKVVRSLKNDYYIWKNTFNLD